MLMPRGAAKTNCLLPAPRLHATLPSAVRGHDHKKRGGGDGGAARWRRGSPLHMFRDAGQAQGASPTRRRRREGGRDGGSAPLSPARRRQKVGVVLLGGGGGREHPARLFASGDRPGGRRPQRTAVANAGRHVTENRRLAKDARRESRASLRLPFKGRPGTANRRIKGWAFWSAAGPIGAAKGPRANREPRRVSPGGGATSQEGGRRPREKR